MNTYFHVNYIDGHVCMSQLYSKFTCSTLLLKIIVYECSIRVFKYLNCFIIDCFIRVFQYVLLESRVGQYCNIIATTQYWGMQYQYRKHFHISIISHMQYIAEYRHISQEILYV